MRVPRIVAAMEYINEKHLSEAMEYNVPRKKSRFKYYAAIAACAALVLTVVVVGGRLSDIEADQSFLIPGTSFCETDDAYYGIAEMENGAVLMYSDKTTGKGGVLCAKPDCGHDTENCNAFLIPLASGLSVYEGRLYWAAQDGFGGEAKVYSLRLDGTDKKAVCRIPSEVFKGGAQIFAKVHRGKMYFGGVYKTVSGGVATEMIKVTSLELKHGGKCCTLFEKDGGFLQMQMRGNAVYMATGCGRDISVYCWNTSDERLSEIYSGELPEAVHSIRLDGSQGAYFAGEGDSVYYLDFKTEEAECKFGFDDIMPGIVNFAEPYICDGTAVAEDMWGNAVICLKSFDGRFMMVYSVAEIEKKIAEMSGEESVERHFLGFDGDNLYYDYCGGKYCVAIPYEYGAPKLIWGTGI